jgi:transglutaminase-like putative cysteine protease
MDHERNLPKSVAVSQGMPYAVGDLLRRHRRLRHLWRYPGWHGGVGRRLWASAVACLANQQRLAHHRAMRREVGAEIEVEITAPTTLEFQIAVAPHPRTEVFESLCFVLNGRPIQPLEVSGVHGNRIHKFDASVGTLKVDYAATIVGQTDPAPVTDYDLSMYLRPSRYAEADKFYGFAATEFGTYGDSATLLENVSSWVGTRLNYVPGSSDPIDGAVDTLLAGAGVCRDYAHLVVALLRAVKVPARLVSVYAPGLYPMDFHAVAEAFVEGQWRVVDATLLAPRQTLVRIATGRDASDTAFLDNHKGQIELNQLVVTAIVDGDLPADSIDQLVSIR